MEDIEKIPTQNSFSVQTFEHAQRVAKMLASSSLIPEEYRGRVDNVMIAMEMANRMNVSPLMVMQNLYIVKGKPGWSGPFIIAIVNNSKRFKTDIKFEFSGDGDSYGCVAWVTDLGGIRVEGTKIDWKMVKGEGWLDKAGSKWKTMPQQMFKYRSATFFGREHTPDLIMGMQAVDEILDITPQTTTEMYTPEQLQIMLDEVVAELTKSEFDNAKRIIQNKEHDSYKKLFTLLKSKENVQNSDNQNN